MLAPLTCIGPLKLSGHYRWREEARLFFKKHRKAEEQQSLYLWTLSHILQIQCQSLFCPLMNLLLEIFKSLCPAKQFTRGPQSPSLSLLCFMQIFSTWHLRISVDGDVSCSPSLLCEEILLKSLHASSLNYINLHSCCSTLTLVTQQL